MMGAASGARGMERVSQQRRPGWKACNRLLARLQDPRDTQAAWLVACALLLFEAALCPLIIAKVPYTELDWVAYMEQVEGFLQGERDYRQLRGQTGPLVYPAGFLYVFSGLHWLSHGGDVASAQQLFAGLYLLTQAVVLWLYIQAQVVPPWALALLVVSKRMHSIFVLRLFNDGVAMLLAYIATGLLAGRRWRASLVMYSAAVSVKMNVLLMAPPVLVVMLKGARVQQAAEGAALGAALQLLLGGPFLLHSAGAYLSRAFELSRVFQHVWTVNLKFLPEDTFQSKGLAVGLLCAHLLLLLAFAHFRWCQDQGGLGGVVRRALRRSGRAREQQVAAGAAPQAHEEAQWRAGAGSSWAAEALWIVFSGNFVGIVCARTLHFQFYAWYFHTIPLLLWCTRLPTPVRLVLWLCIEAVFNIYPSTALSSALLLAAHVVLLTALWLRNPLSSKATMRRQD